MFESNSENGIKCKLAPLLWPTMYISFGISKAVEKLSEKVVITCDILPICALLTVDYCSVGPVRAPGP